MTSLDGVLIHVIKSRPVALAPTSRHPFNVFDLRALVLMRQATDGIGQVADRVAEDLPWLVDRISRIGMAA